MSSVSNDVYQFGRYRLDADQRVLTRENQRIPLQPKSFDLLLLLVRSPGRAFSKEELMAALWPGTFVEDANLTFQISALRRALGGGASEWIETVPKHGYRFAGEVVGTAPQGPGPSLAQAPGARSPNVWRVTGVIVGLMILAAGYLVVVHLQPAQPNESANAVPTPLTAYPGSETGPSLSPDGSQVAFSWNGQEDNHDVYVKLVGPGEPIRLTTAPERDESPSWSPDGGRIAFVRHIRERIVEIFVMPALGGAERRVASLVLDSSRRSTRLSWSPDGKWVAIGGKPSPSEPLGLWLVEIDGAEKRRLTTPPRPGWHADYAPVFSPDGRRIAFIRTRATKDAIFILPVSPAMRPAGEPVEVLSDPRRTQIRGHAWTPDGGSLVFSVGRTPGAHAARTTCRIAGLDRRSQTAPPALRGTCNADRHRGHWTHGVLGPPQRFEFLEARCDAT